MVLEAVCLQSTDEGCAEELGWAWEGQSRQAVEERLAKGLSTDLRVSVRRVVGPLWRQIYHSEEVGNGTLTRFPIPNHTGGLKRQNGFRTWFDAYSDV